MSKVQMFRGAIVLTIMALIYVFVIHPSDVREEQEQKQVQEEYDKAIKSGQENMKTLMAELKSDSFRKGCITSIMRIKSLSQKEQADGAAECLKDAEAIRKEK